MDLFERARAHVEKTQPRIVLPEQGDARVAAAAQQLERLGCTVLPAPALGDRDADLAQPFRERKPGIAEAKVADYLRDPTHRAAALLALGEADLLVAGAITETATVLRAGLRAVGLSAEAPLICSSFLLNFPDGRQFLFGDCAVNIDPDATQLAHIGQHLARAASALFGEARLALLSYSTGSSGAGPSVDKVRTATKILRQRGLNAAGPVQGDAALNAEIGARKGLGEVNPNVLLFPQIDAGNIGYKLMQELAGAQAIGPLLHGFARPVADLSRGARADDMVKVALIAALISDPDPRS